MATDVPPKPTTPAVPPHVDAAPLDWRTFLARIAAMPASELTEEVLFGLVERLVVDACLLAPYIQFKPTGYARNVLYRDDKFEAICLCWEPGQGTAIHNHGGSYGVVVAYEGSLMVDQFRRVDDGSRPGHAELVAIARTRLGKGTIMLDRAGGIHSLYNRAGSGGRVVSLHFYAGPLDTMELFDRETGSVTVKPMQAEPMAYVEPEASVMAAMI